jgi:hypothetical protein
VQHQARARLRDADGHTDQAGIPKMCSREGSNFAKLSRPYETRRNDA